MNLAWIDIETTGLDPRHDEILELALIITTQDLHVVMEKSWVVSHVHDLRSHMNDWVLRTHTESGLLEDLRRAVDTIEEVDQEAAAAVKHWRLKDKSILAGSSPHFDRSFIAQHMPELNEALHYRNFDTSTIERAFEFWRPDLRQPREGRNVAHRAMADIRWSLECARYYQGVIQSLRTTEALP